ncbi:dirigent protein 2-like [Salvia hispanica]|uniref:dirigent protein 2-like n=1 Tax=Salvia hispanica TaxID=49212 RepID=UPI00200914DC|nr:dirigent protein 2-like [Salvia hispanica]
MVLCNGSSLNKKATFRVYLQEILSGPNATLYEVARANITSTSPTNFGQFLVGDDFVTATPDPNSMRLGRSQGFVAFSDLDDIAIVLTYTFIFTDGPYRGSSLTIAGRKMPFVKNQEIPIIGGTGVFRLARGYTISSLFSSTPNTFVFVYDFYVV